MKGRQYCIDSEGEDSDEMQQDEKDTEKKQPTLQQWLRKRGCSVGAAPLQSVVAQTSEMGPAPN